MIQFKNITDWGISKVLPYLSKEQGEHLEVFHQPFLKLIEKFWSELLSEVWCQGNWDSWFPWVENGVRDKDLGTRGGHCYFDSFAFKVKLPVSRTKTHMQVYRYIYKYILHISMLHVYVYTHILITWIYICTHIHAHTNYIYIWEILSPCWYYQFRSILTGFCLLPQWENHGPQQPRYIPLFAKSYNRYQLISEFLCPYQ